MTNFNLKSFSRRRIGRDRWHQEDPKNRGRRSSTKNPSWPERRNRAPRGFSTRAVGNEKFPAGLYLTPSAAGVVRRTPCTFLGGGGNPCCRIARMCIHPKIVRDVGISAAGSGFGRPQGARRLPTSRHPHSLGRIETAALLVFVVPPGMLTDRDFLHIIQRPEPQSPWPFGTASASKILPLKENPVSAPRTRTSWSARA